MTDYATLGVGFDATGLEKGADALDNVNTSAKAVGSSVDAVTAAADRMSKAMDGAARITAAQYREMQAAEAAAKAYKDSIQAIVDKYDPLSAKTRQVQAEIVAMQNALKDGIVPTQFLAQAETALGNAQKSLAALKAPIVEVGPAAGAAFGQLTDAAEKGTQMTVRARTELIVLAHEFVQGRFSRIPGSFMVLAESMGRMGERLLWIGGIAAAVGGSLFLFFKAIHDGIEEQKNMDLALKNTSNYAGMTEDSMKRLADSMTVTGIVTSGTARLLVTELVASGKIGHDALASISSLASDFAHATHQDVAKIAPELIKLFADPAKGAEELNRSMHFLSAAQLEHIKELERMGQLGQAQLELSNQVKDHIPKHVDNLGTLEKKLNEVRQAWAAMWAAAKGIGTKETPDQASAEIRDIDKRIFELGGGSSGRSAFAPDRLKLDAGVQIEIQMLEARRASLSILVEQGRVQTQQAQAQSEIAASQERGLKAAKEGETSAQGHLRILQQQRDALKASLQDPNAGLSEPQRLDVIRKIYEYGLQIRDTYFNMSKEERESIIENGRAQKQALDDEYDRGIQIYRSLLTTKEVTQSQYDLAVSEYEIAKNQAAITEKQNELDAGALPNTAQKLRDELAHLQALKDTLVQKQADKQFEDDELPRLRALAEARAHADQVHADYWNAVNVTAPRALEKINEETKLLGMSETQHRVMIDMLKLEAMGIKEGTDEWKRWKQAFEDAYANQAAIKNQLGMWKEAAGWVAGFADALMGGASNAVTYLRNLLKKLLADIVSIFATRWILNLGANLAGGSSTSLGGTLTNAAAQTGVNTIAGAGASAAGSLIGGAGTAIGGAYGAGEGFAMGWASGVAAPTAGYAEVAGAAASGIYDGVVAIAGEIPVIGWVILAAAAIYAIWGQKPGGPKTGGSALGSFDATGSLSANMTGSLDRNQHLQDETQQDAAALTVTQSIAANYAAAMHRFGMQMPDGMQFGIGWNRDPAGNAPSMVSSLVRDANGNTIFEQSNRGVGRDAKDVQAEVQLQASRAVLAALQATTTGALQGYLKQFDATKVTATDLSAIYKAADAIRQLTEDSTNLDSAITDISTGSFNMFRSALDAVKQKVVDARDAFNSVRNSNDPAAVLQAEQNLRSAIINRYTTEMNLVRELADAIKQLQQQAYQFSIGIQQRIIAAGGTANISGDSWDYAQSLRGKIGGNSNPTGQLTDLNNYLGALDTWYGSEKSRIENNIKSQQAAAQAAAQAEQSATQAQLAAMQQQLQLAQQWKSVLDQTSQIITSMRLTDANPLSASGRLGLSQGDTSSLFAKFQGSTGTEQQQYAAQLLPALQSQLSLLQSNYQRPSNEYQAGYNAIMVMLTAVQSVAKTESEKAADIQQQMLVVQQRSAAFQASISANVSAGNAELDDLNKRYIEQLSWAKGEGARLYALQIKQHQEQLDAITGGMDVELFIAQDTAAMLKELKMLRDDVNTFLASLANGTSVPGSGGTPSGGGSPGTGGNGPPLGGGLDNQGGITIVVNGTNATTGAEIVDHITRNASTIRRVLDRT